MTRVYTEKQPKTPGMYRCIASSIPELVFGQVYYIDFPFLSWEDTELDLRVFVKGDLGGTVNPTYGQWEEMSG